MNAHDFKSLQRGLAQVATFEGGDHAGFAVHEPVDVKEIRQRLGQTQGQFAAIYHLPIGTVRDWEQGRRLPDAPARALLTAIARDPAAMERLLA